MQAQRAYDREQKRLHIESRLAYVDEYNQDLERTLSRLANLLTDALATRVFDLEWLKESQHVEIADAGIMGITTARPSLTAYLPPDLSGFRKILSNERKKYVEQVQHAHQRYQYDLAAYESSVNLRLHQIEKFERAIASGSAHAIMNYFILVLETSIYPDNFPLLAEVAFLPESKMLIVDYDLPSFDIIPTVGLYRYIRSRDEVAQTVRPLVQRKALYGLVIAQVTLRTLHELFNADRSQMIETVVFNGYVDAINPATGLSHHPCIISVRTTSTDFRELDLGKVDPESCLRSLRASLSKNPAENVAVRTLLNIESANRSAFVGKASSHDQIPNLLDMDPLEFERLIAVLFEKMGLETELTQASHDGGIDCVAYDRRPIIGGMSVIQVKRYRHTVGVSVVRDLFGVVQDRRASKGILVTTSSYGNDSFKFAEGKPIELIDGRILLHLLSEHLGMTARIDIVEQQPSDRA